MMLDFLLSYLKWGNGKKKKMERIESCLKITIPHKKLTFDLLPLLYDCAKQCIFSLKKVAEYAESKMIKKCNRCSLAT